MTEISNLPASNHNQYSRDRETYSENQISTWIDIRIRDEWHPRIATIIQPNCVD